MEIIVKNYCHYNRALGKYISSKRDYVESMKRGGFVSFEKGQQLAEQSHENKRRAYNGLSPKATEIIKSASNIKDSKGRIKPSDRLIDGMKEVGVNFYNSNLPKHYSGAFF